MKRYIKNILPAAAMLLTVGLSSCIGDLDVTPIDPNKKTDLDPVALFNQCYANLSIEGLEGPGKSTVTADDPGTTGLVRQYFNANELTTDEAICSWTDPGVATMNTNEQGASNAFLAIYYNRLYSGISVCNHYLEVASDVDATRTAEVRFLRALQFYLAMDAFGNIGLPLTVRGSNFMIEAYVWLNNKRIGGLYELCLEGGNEIMFTKETVRKHNLMAYEGKTQQLLAQYTNIGDTTTTTTTFALADSVYLGLQNIGRVAVNISLPTLHAFPQMRNVGYIGASILHNYNLVFDPAHNKLYYRPYKAYTPEKRTWGFSWVNRTDIGKGWIVRSIYKGSAAEKAGIKLGDTIIKVNGKKVENYSWDEERALSPKLPITLVLKTRKGVRKVTIETMTVF